MPKNIWEAFLFHALPVNRKIQKYLHELALGIFSHEGKCKG